MSLTLTTILSKIGMRLKEYRTLHELRVLDDRSLEDIGLDRSMLRGAAHRAARTSF